MAIRAACQCGAQFAAKAELAGKTVACPTCGQHFVIPSQVAALGMSTPQSAMNNGLANPAAADDFWNQGNAGSSAGNATATLGSPGAANSFGQPLAGMQTSNWATSQNQGTTFTSPATAPTPKRRKETQRSSKKPLLVGFVIVAGAVAIGGIVIIVLNLERINIAIYGEEKFKAKEQYGKIENGMSSRKVYAILNEIPWRSVERQSETTEKRHYGSHGNALGSSSSGEVHIIFKLSPEDDTDYAIILRFKDGVLTSKRKQEF